MRRSRQLSLKECYQILSLGKGATLEDVKRTYRRRAFELHPDLNPGNPDAASQFQRLNEAYVALSKVLQVQEKAAETKNSESAADGHAASSDDARNQQNTEGSRQNRESSFSDAQYTTHTAESAATEETAGQSGSKAAEEDTRKRANAAYGKEDVLRDLLNDPFARRVFEDIYSEVNKQEKPSPPPTGPSSPPPSPPKPRNVSTEWGLGKLNLDFNHGFKGVVKGWLRSQIDEIQTFKLPASSLIPRARIRLQIRRGLSDDLVTVEITLPPDFIVGKPVRLKGLGKRIGPWQGDLYLTLEPK